MHRAYFVDDEPLVLEEMISSPLLADSGFQVVGSSTNPYSAAKEIKRLNPDAVFTDLKMPGRSGVDMMEELRKNGVDCEFIVISAFPEFEESRRFFLMGGFNYLIKPVSDRDLQNLLEKLSAKLAGKKSQQRKDTDSPELNQMTAYLSETLAGKHSLESLSARFSVNATYISQLFANHLGTTFSAYMQGLRMEEAARLLKETRKDIKEITWLCGYEDYFYFCRVFRKYHACTPSAFRKALK